MWSKWKTWRKKRKPDFDERQINTRNKVGREMFLVLFHVIFASAGVYLWFELDFHFYPLVVILLALACMVVYIIRLAVVGALMPFRVSVKRSVVTALVVIPVYYFLTGSLVTVLIGAGLGIAIVANAAVNQNKSNEDEDEDKNDAAH